MASHADPTQPDDMNPYRAPREVASDLSPSELPIAEPVSRAKIIAGAVVIAASFVFWTLLIGLAVWNVKELVVVFGAVFGVLHLGGFAIWWYQIAAATQERNAAGLNQTKINWMLLVLLLLSLVSVTLFFMLLM